MSIEWTSSFSGSGQLAGAHKNGIANGCEEGNTYGCSECERWYFCFMSPEITHRCAHDTCVHCTSHGIKIIPISFNSWSFFALYKRKSGRLESDDHDYTSGNIRPEKVWQAAKVLVELPLYRSYNFSVLNTWLWNIDCCTNPKEDDGDSNIENDEDEAGQFRYGGDTTSCWRRLRIGPAKGYHPVA